MFRGLNSDSSLLVLWERKSSNGVPEYRHRCFRVAPSLLQVYSRKCCPTGHLNLNSGSRLNRQFYKCVDWS